MEQIKDEELVKLACNGDAVAFKQLIERHYMTIYKMAYKWIGNKEDAEEIAQEASIKLANNLSSFRHDAAFTSWLYRLVVNTAKDYVRKKNRQRDHELPIYEDVEFIAPKADQEAQLQTKQTLKFLDKLPDKIKAAVILVCWEGLNHKEASIILECKESTVSWRIHEARKLMAEVAGKGVHYG